MTNNQKYASFKLRYLAFLIDTGIYLLFNMSLLYFISTRGSLADTFSAIILSLIIILNPLVVYSSILFIHFFRATPGKLITGLSVVTVDDTPLSLKKIIFRQTVGYSFSWIFFGLGYLSIIKDGKKQAWHDKTVNSVVKVKGNLSVVGVAVLIILYIASISLVVKSVQGFISGPAAKELLNFSIKQQVSKPAYPANLPEQLY